jgi:hypothetical protein
MVVGYIRIIMVTDISPDNAFAYHPHSTLENVDELL